MDPNSMLHQKQYNQQLGLKYSAHNQYDKTMESDFRHQTICLLSRLESWPWRIPGKPYKSGNVSKSK